jgi:hypothetical protein
VNIFSSRTATAAKRIVVILAALLIWPITASAQLNVLISGGFTGAYEQLLVVSRTRPRCADPCAR